MLAIGQMVFVRVRGARGVNSILDVHKFSSAEHTALAQYVMASYTGQGVRNSH